MLKILPKQLISHISGITNLIKIVFDVKIKDYRQFLFCLRGDTFCKIAKMIKGQGSFSYLKCRLNENLKKIIFN